MMDKLSVGSTGTQVGMTHEQKGMVGVIAREWQPSEWHHGDCIGADEEVHRIVYSFVEHCLLVGHPPSNPSKRAYCKFDSILQPLPYLERNHNIVLATDALIATPKEDIEVMRSGTWATVRFAVKQGRPVYIILPSGTVATYDDVRML